MNKLIKNKEERIETKYKSDKNSQLKEKNPNRRTFIRTEQAK